jgi:hypothetical protein
LELFEERTESESKVRSTSHQVQQKLNVAKNFKAWLAKNRHFTNYRPNRITAAA